MADLVSNALRLVTRPGVNYNPGIVPRCDYRPITLPHTMGGPLLDTEPGTNIYASRPTHRHASALVRGSINAKILHAVRNGYNGSSTDFWGALMLCLFQNDIEGWDKIFTYSDTKLGYGQVVAAVTGVRFEVIYPLTTEAGLDDPQKIHDKLRSLMVHT